MTDKEKIECLSDLCRFLAGTQEEQRASILKSVSRENYGDCEKMRNQLILNTPMVQGTMNQIKLANIGKQETNTKNIGKAVEYLLGEKD